MFGGVEDVKRANPLNPSAADFPSFAKFDGRKVESKLSEIRGGGELRERNPPFPRSRRCQDFVWVILFFFVVLAVLISAYIFSEPVYEASLLAGSDVSFKEGVKKTEDGSDIKADEHDSKLSAEAQEQNIYALMFAGFAGAVVSTVASFAYIFLAHIAPKFIVYCSLFLGPAMLVVFGIILIVVGATMGGSGWLLIICGVVLLFLGFCLGSCVLCCYRHLIPLMIVLVEVVTGIVEEYVGVLFLGLLGAIVGILWTVACGIAFFGAYLENRDHFDLGHEKSTRTASYIFTGACTLIFTWGMLVQVNTCHVAYCGVFGRWYYGRTQSQVGEKVFTSSVRAAFSTSFGSVCLGSFLVAFVRSIEAVARKCMDDAWENGNAVLCVIACLIKCIVECIGDILEYFNSFAYVSCAVRGVSFCEAAKITYSMMTCANMSYVLRDLLLDSVVELGALLCAVTGGITGLVVGALLSSSTVIRAGGGMVGLIMGYTAGRAVIGVISSGVKTIVVCWADDPEPLRYSHPEVHSTFAGKVADGCAEDREDIY